MKETFLILLSLSLLIMMLGIKTKSISKLDNISFYSISALGFIFTRIVFTLLMFIVFNRQGPGDLTDVFYPQALLAKNGSLIYNDFESSYSLLFPYLLSLPLYIWNNPLSIIFFFALFELLVLFVSTKYIIPKFDLSAREFVWFFIFCPVNIIFTVFYVQDEIIVAFFMVTAFSLIIEKKHLLATFVLILGFYFTKLISIYFFIPFLILMDKKYLLIFTLVIVVGNLILYSTGIDLLFPLREGGALAMGPNIWALLENLGITVKPKLAYSILLIITGLLVIIQIRLQKIRGKNNFELNDILRFILLYSLVFMSFSKKSFSFYFLIIIVFYLIVIINNFKFSHVSTNNAILNLNPTQWAILLYLFLISILYSYEKIGYQYSIDITANVLILTTFLLQIMLLYMLLSDAFKQNKIKLIKF